LIETDAPFLAPLPFRGKRNEPAWVARVAERLGQVWGVPMDQVASSTANNFFRFFGVTPDQDFPVPGQQPRLRA
jgi:TatD DNase family protein